MTCHVVLVLVIVGEGVSSMPRRYVTNLLASKIEDAAQTQCLVQNWCLADPVEGSYDE